MSDDNLVEVYRAKDVLEAHLLKSTLEDAGIRAEILGEQLAGVLGEVPLGWSSAPRIVVHESDASRARELLLSQTGPKS